MCARVQTDVLRVLRVPVFQFCTCLWRHVRLTYIAILRMGKVYSKPRPCSNFGPIHPCMYESVCAI